MKCGLCNDKLNIFDHAEVAKHLVEKHGLSEDEAELGVSAVEQDAAFIALKNNPMLYTVLAEDEFWPVNNEPEEGYICPVCGRITQYTESWPNKVCPGQYPQNCAGTPVVKYHYNNNDLESEVEPINDLLI